MSTHPGPVTAISGGLVALIICVGATVLLVGQMAADPPAGAAGEPAGIGPQPRVFPGTPDALERRLGTQQPAPQANPAVPRSPDAAQQWLGPDSDGIGRAIPLSPDAAERWLETPRLDR